MTRRTSMNGKRLVATGLLNAIWIASAASLGVYGAGFPEAPTDQPANPPVFLVIDEDSIDERKAPNNFSSTAINDHIAKVGLRTQLPYFQQNPGKTIPLFPGNVGDEGWFAVPTILASWAAAGPTPDGLRNFLGNPSRVFPHNVGPGLGAGTDPEKLLDKIPGVTPLTATHLGNLVGWTICAIVYDGDISINYSPLNGSLKGANLGTVAFEVVSTTPRTGRNRPLPQMNVRILDARQLCEAAPTTVLPTGPPAPPPPTNGLPIAAAGADQRIFVGALVSLDGRASSDPDSDPLTFDWKFTAKPTSSLAALTNVSTSTPTFTPDVAGPYDLELTVRDGRGGQATDTVRVVADPINRPPTANAGADQRVDAGTVVNLDGRGSADPDSDALTFEWTLSDKPAASLATLTNAATSTPTFTPDTDGSYDLRLTVRDGRGGEATDTMKVVADPVNRAPAITSEPAINATADQAYVYDVEASDPDADALTYSLVFAPAGMTIDANTGLIQWTPTAQQAGVRSAHVQVTDGKGGTANQGLAIDVSAPINRPPVATNDAFEARLGEALIVPAAGVLENDVDPDLNVLNAELMSPPSEGTVALDPNGGFTYTPRPIAAPGLLNPTVEFVKNTFRVAPNSKQVMMTPIVADISADGVPDIAIATHTGSSWTGRGYLRLLAGGRALVRDFNLVRLGSASIQVSSTFSASFNPERAIDGDINTSWFTARPDTSAFFQISFTSNVTVREFRMLGNRESANGHDFVSGVFQLFDENNVLLYDSGSVSLPALPSDIDRDLVLTLPTEIAGVRRVRFSGVGEIPSTDHGFAEIEVIGDGIADPGTELWTVSDPLLQVHGSSGLAAGDIDLDGFMEIVAQDANGGLIAFEHDGTFKWRSVPVGLGGNTVGSPALADLDADGIPEIVVGSTVLNNDGTIRWQGAAALGPGNNGFGPLSLVADLDLDGRPEVVTGKTAFRADGSVYWTSSLADAFTAAGNFDADPNPEIVHVANGSVRLLDHNGAVKWGPVSIGGGRGGPPTIADFDSDGEPEIGVAGSDFYVALETNGTIKWQVPIQDNSSNVTGSSVFDFEGDGSAEVVYGDELYLRIYRGADGFELYRLEKGSATLHEIPTVADVDGDGQAEIVAAANNWLHGGQFGVYVIGGADGNWIPTRKIWNQHSYHVTNVSADGVIPRVESHHWLVPGLNAFRQNAFAPGDPDRVTSFTYRVTDGSLQSNDATVHITIRQPNSAPTFATEPVRNAASSLEYLYGAAITDPDRGDIHTFALLTSPGGMTIDSMTGLIRWTPAPGQLGDHAVTVRVLDRGGLFDLQTYTLHVTNPVTVPTLAGEHQDSAQSLISSAGLKVGMVGTAFSATVPQMHVISQELAAGTLVAPETAVNFLISSGPAPVSVPNLLGLAQEAAGAVLSASGLALGTITSATSMDMPPGHVLSQIPAAGTVVFSPSPVDLVISTGSALHVGLDRSIVDAGMSLAFVVQAFDEAGNPIVPLPPLNLAVTFVPGEAQGTLPTISGNTIVTASSTRGVYTLVASLVSTGDTASARFVVSRPAATPSEQTLYASLGTTLDSVSVDVLALQEAVATGDLSALAALKASLLGARDSIDLARLRKSTAFAPEGGFPPTPATLTAAGFAETAADVSWNTALRQVNAKLLQIETFLDQLSPAGLQNDDVRLEQLNAELNALVVQVNALTPSVHGVVKRANVLNHLVSVRIPRVVHAQVNLIARTLEQQGLARLWQEPNLYYGVTTGLHARRSTGLDPDQYYARLQPTFFSLPGMLGATKVHMDIVKDLYVPIIGQLVKAGIILIGNDLLQTYTNAGELVSVITTASQSFHFFEIPGSVIEGFGFDRDHPDANDVYLVGPAAIDAVLDVLGEITPDGVEDLLDLAEKFADVEEAAKGVEKAFNDANSQPNEVIRGCVFDFSPACMELVYDSGFASVYERDGPTDFPAPVLVIVRNVNTGNFGTLVVNFFPSNPE